jgi:hypothetical protein
MSHVASESDERTVNNTMRHQYRVLTDAEKKDMVRLKDMGIEGPGGVARQDEGRGSRHVGGQGAHRIGGRNGDSTEAETEA